MTLKTYRGNTMAETLAQVKKDLGGDAVILHTRTYRIGGIAGFGGKSVIEITASDQAPTATVRASRGPGLLAPPTATLRPRGARRPEPAEAARSTRTEPERFEPAVWSRAPSGEELPPRRPEPEEHPLPAAPQPEEAAPASTVAAAAPAARLAVRAPLAPIDAAARRTLEEELVAIKRLVGQVLQCTRHTAAKSAVGSGSPGAAVIAAGGMDEPLFACYLRLTEAGVASDIVEELIGRVRDELEAGELRNPEVVSTTVERRLAELIRVVGSAGVAGRMNDGRPLTIALVGPTGVGKTTTIAKLAATYKLRHAKRVGLVTSDTYRIAAVDQLRVYANIIGLPLKVVMNPRELDAACDALSDCDCILVDTAGRSQHDAGRLDELRDIVGAARPHETHLVLSAAVAEPVLRRAADRFSVLGPDRLLFTKLDEAVQFGALVNVAVATGLPVSYLTTGQEVPEQIERADGPRLARIVLRGENPA